MAKSKGQKEGKGKGKELQTSRDERRRQGDASGPGIKDSDENFILCIVS